jgi:4-amino-4-deoxy-L-arabinose transferase-like glycosyltransferase
MRAHDVNPIMRFPEKAELYDGWLGLLLNPWAHFDGVWFIHIANEGYRLDNNTPAFFPLYPITLKAGGALLLGNFELAGIALSVLFFFAAMWALYHLVAREFSARTAFYAVVFVSLSPVSFFFQTVYSESLFLLLSVLCFMAVEQRRWPLAGVAGMLATATRLAGVFLLVPMALAYLRDRESGDARRDRPLLWFLLVPAGVAVYAAYLAVITGEPGTFGSAERAWGRDPALPFLTVWRAAAAAYHGATYLLFGFGIPADPAYVGETLAFIRRETAIVNLASFVALAFAVVVIAAAWRRLPLSYSLYALALVCLPLLAPRPQVPLMSMPRFVLVAFPVMVGLAVLTERRPVLRWVMIGCFVAGLVFLTGRFALWLFVA